MTGMPMGTSHRHGRIFGGLMALVILAGMLGVAMVLAEGIGLLDIPVGDNVVAILAVTMASLVFASLAYRVHPPWMNFFAKVSPLRLLLRIAHSGDPTRFRPATRSLFGRFCYSMAAHMPSRASPHPLGRCWNIHRTAISYSDPRFVSANDDTSDLRDTMLSANCGRERLSSSSTVSRSWRSMPARASPLVSLFRLLCVNDRTARFSHMS
jgi:hypothetical protein